MSVIHIQQQNDLAGKSKLTAVTIASGHRKITKFLNLRHDSEGKAILPTKTLNSMLDAINCHRGDTYSMG